MMMLSIHVKVSVHPFTACVFNCELLTSCAVLSELCWSALLFGPIILSLLCVFSYLEVCVNTAALSNSHNSSAFEPSVEANQDLSPERGPGRIQSCDLAFLFLSFHPSHLHPITLTRPTTLHREEEGGGKSGKESGLENILQQAGRRDLQEKDEIKDPNICEPCHPQVATP